jgi:putative transposase
VPTWSGFAYVALVIDLYSRAVVGWSAATHKREEFVSDALKMAVWRREYTARPRTPGMIHHSDYAEPCVKPRDRVLVCACGVV